MVNIASLTCNAAFISWHARTPPSHAHIIDILLSAGCVLYARTTQPQTLMHLETSSNYYGTTVNPFNRTLTSGGSSGGEGALLGLRGSCMGIGTDIGGSIRGPAANNGVYGLRPTSRRLPMQGMTATMLGSEHILPVIGPMTTSLGGVKLFMKTLIEAEPWVREPSLVPLRWKTEAQFPVTKGGGKRMRVGVLTDDGVVRPHRPVLRALEALAEGLRRVEGVEVVPFTPYKHDEAWTIISSLYFADGGAEEKAAIAASGEPWRPLSKFILTENPNVKRLSIEEVWDLTIRREAYRDEYAKHWEESGIDVLLCPVGPGAAPPLECARYWGWVEPFLGGRAETLLMVSNRYTSQWNLLDYPSLVAPVSKVLSTDVADADYVPRNEQDRYNHQLCKFTQFGVEELLADHS